jgi:hypothetical protein
MNDKSMIMFVFSFPIDLPLVFKVRQRSFDSFSTEIHLRKINLILLLQFL